MVRHKEWRLTSPRAVAFDAFITVDRKLSSQHNLSSFDLRVIVIAAPSNRLLDLRVLVPKVLETLASLKPGEAILVR
jgi:hypothetical protein